MVLHEGSSNALPHAALEPAPKTSSTSGGDEATPEEVMALAGPARGSGSGENRAPNTAVYSGGPVASPRTLLDILFTTVDSYPDAIALDDGAVTLTYMDLLGRIESLSLTMRAAGIGTGDRVGIRVPSGTVDLYIAILAALHRGAAYVPVDHDESEEWARFVWAEASVTVVIESGLDVRLREESPPRGEDRTPTGDDDAWIFFASGVSHKSRGIAISHRSAAAFVDAEASMYCVDSPLGPGDRVLAGLSVGTDASCEEMWLAWRHGASLVTAPHDVVRSGEDLGPWLVERGITVVSTNPTSAASWPTEALDTIRLLILGGGACPPELVAHFATEGREVWNTYGPPGATVVSCAAPVDGAGPARIGLPLRGCQLAVVDAEDQPVAWGEAGELVIGGVGLGRCLDPETDAEMYAPMTTLGWPRACRSGDLVRAETEGLVLLGRTEDRIKHGGQAIEHAEVDEALRRPDAEAGAAQDATRSTPRWTALLQMSLIAGLYGITGLRYVTGVAIVCLVLFQLGQAPWAPNPPLVPTILAWLVLFSLPVRALAVIGSARLLMREVRPGMYPRGGSVHMRLWTAERIMAYCQVDGLMGTPMASAFARALGAEVGRNVHLDALPPVTGLAVIESGASIEHDVDIAGHWLEGDTLIIGSVKVCKNARVGTRSIVQGGAEIGADAEIAPGSVVTGEVPQHEHWAGSPLERVGASGKDWPDSAVADTRRPRGLAVMYSLGLVLLGLLPVLATLPGAAILLYLISDVEALAPALWTFAAWTPAFVAVTALTYLSLIAGSVRLMGRLMPRGTHSVHSVPAWAAWMSARLMSKSRSTLHPLYGSLLAPIWLRLLGARVGRNVEASTVEAIPHLSSVGDTSFLAEHSLVSSRCVRGGWMRLDSGSLGQKAFLGNSAILGPNQRMPFNSLVAVLSSAPKNMPPNSLWMGNRPIELPRVPENVDASSTYEPTRALKLARASVELFRLVPMFISAWLALITLSVLAMIYTSYGLGLTVLLSGPVLLASAIVAAVIPMAAKWLLVGRFKSSQRPLWSSFVWRNQLAACFSETLAVPGLIRMSQGTPLLNLWLRGMGARIGRGVWCETWRLPEFDLIQLDEGVTVNRGTVLQTHLFHDRIMRMGRIRFEEGSSIGPNSFVLPGSSLGPRARVGAGSLVTCVESIQEATTWSGNPIRQTTPEIISTRESPEPAAARR